MDKREALNEIVGMGEAQGDARPEILVLAHSDLARDPRVNRQICWLRTRYAVIAAGYAPPNDTGVRFLDMSPKPLAANEASELQGHGAPRPTIARRLIRTLRYRLAQIPGARLLVRRDIAAGIALRYRLAQVSWARRLVRRCIAAASALRLGLARNPGPKAPYGGARSGRSEGSILPAADSAASGASMAEQAAERERLLQYFTDKLHGMTDLASLAGLRPDLVVANDLDCLALAELAFPSAPVLFDAHEYSPLEYNEGEHWLNHEQPARIIQCERLLPGVAAMSTVCTGIAEEYARNFAVGAPIEVILNAPFYEDLVPRPTARPIRIVHHGIAAPIRRIEVMAEVLKRLDDRFELYLILVEGSREYIDELRATYSQEPRIHFLDPVPMPEISRYISQFDIGLFILEPAIFNYKFALPNKFFEFVQARLAIAVGPSPEMARIVRERELGVVAADFSAETMAASLGALTAANIDRFKANTHRAALGLSAESNGAKMLAMVERTLSRASGAGVV